MLQWSSRVLTGLQMNCFQQVAAFRATLEEISESSLLVHVVDIRYDIVQMIIEFIPDDHCHYLIPYNYQVQPSTGGATGTCSGRSFVGTGCIINSKADGLEQGILRYFLVILIGFTRNLFTSTSINLDGSAVMFFSLWTLFR
jgi:hypothetical protein